LKEAEPPGSPFEFLEANSVVEAFSFSNQEIDLILLDLDMPGSSGSDTLNTMRSAFPSVRIIVVSSEDDPKAILQIIKEGACGFIPKSSVTDLLPETVHKILSGGVYLPKRTAQTLGEAILPTRPTGADTTAQGPAVSAAEIGLSPRQYQVVMMVVEGAPHKSIARKLSLSDGTIKAPLSPPYRLFVARHPTAAAVKLARAGYSPMST